MQVTMKPFTAVMKRIWSVMEILNGLWQNRTYRENSFTVSMIPVGQHLTDLTSMLLTINI